MFSAKQGNYLVPFLYHLYTKANKTRYFLELLSLNISVELFHLYKNIITYSDF